MAPAVRVYGTPGSFGSLQSRDTLTTGPSLECHDTGLDFEPGAAPFFGAVAPDGCLIIGTDPLTDNQVNSTYVTQSVGVLDPAKTQFRSVVAPTSTGAATMVGGNGVTGGADVSDIAIANVGTGRVPVGVCASDVHGQQFSTKGRHNCWLVFRQDDRGLWVLDAARSKTADQLAVGLGASAFPDGTNSFGEHFAQNPGLNEADVFSASGHVVIACYFPLTATTGKYSGAVLVIDPTTSTVAGWLRLPDFQTADGTLLTVSPRTVACDPSSSLSDERFVVIPDVFVRGGSTSVPFACQEFKYDSTLALANIADRVTVTSAPFVAIGDGDDVAYPSYNSRCNAAVFGSDGTLYLARSQAVGLASFNARSLAVWKKTAGERSYTTTAPPTAGYENAYAVRVLPDWYVGAQILGGNVARGGAVDPATGAVLVVGQTLVVDSHLPDSPLVNRAENLPNPSFASNNTGWSNVAGSTAQAWDAGDSGRLKMTATGGAFANATVGTPTGLSGLAISGWDNQSATVTATVKNNATARTFQCAAQFYDSTGAVVGGGLTYGPKRQGVVGSYVTCAAPYKVPVGAVFAAVFVQVNGPVAAEIHYVGDVSLRLAPFTSARRVDLDGASLTNGQPGRFQPRGLAIDPATRRGYISYQQLDPSGYAYPVAPQRRPQWIIDVDLDFLQARVREFTPAVEPRVPLVTPQATAAQRALYRHFGPYNAGVTVFKLTDGTITTQQPVSRSLIAQAWYGGHRHPVTAADAALLVAAGYGANLS